MPTAFTSKLHQMTVEYPTEYWNDSCSVEELGYAVSHGAVGATTNPTILLNALKKDMHLWQDCITALIHEHPTWDETAITWKLIKKMAVHGASFLKPALDLHHGMKGRLSIQTNPILYRNAGAMTQQAISFNELAPNMQVKIPVTSAGLQAIEEATYCGVSINATVSFTVAQAIAVAEAVERGLNRRAASGQSIKGMVPLCIIMVGRTDDWLKVVAKRDGINVDPACLEWAGIACLKKAYDIYHQRGYRTRLLVAAYRHLGHITEFIGGDLVLSIPYDWQIKFNQSDLPLLNRIDVPVDPEMIETLSDNFQDFRDAYAEDGLTVKEFDTYGATLRTLRGFIASTHDLAGLVRDVMLPNPDIQ